MSRISVVIPVYNGATTIASVVDEVKRELSSSLHEIVLVNDGSQDNSEAVCTELASQEDSVKFLSLRRNFGEHNAVMCGLYHTDGDFVAIIDDDFQNPASAIAALVQAAIEGGYDAVYSRYSKKMHSRWRNSASWLMSSLTSYLFSKPTGLYLSSFKVIRREVVREIIQYKGPFPYIDALLFRVTDNVGSVLVHHRDRAAGESNYSLTRLITLALHIIFHYSLVPLRAFFLLGFIILAIGTCAMGATLIGMMFNLFDGSGWILFSALLTVLLGVQFVITGVVGEYVGRQLLEQNGTPQWIVKQAILESSRNDA